MDAASKAKSDYWNKRLRRPAVARLTIEAFVTELSRRLQSDPAYRGDIRFRVLRSAGAVDTMTWEGAPGASRLVARILHDVSSDFEMPAPFQMEPIAPLPDVSDDVGDIQVDAA